MKPPTPPTIKYAQYIRTYHMIDFLIWGGGSGGSIEGGRDSGLLGYSSRTPAFPRSGVAFKGGFKDHRAFLGLGLRFRDQGLGCPFLGSLDDKDFSILGHEGGWCFSVSRGCGRRWSLELLLVSKVYGCRGRMMMMMLTITNTMTITIVQIPC